MTLQPLGRILHDYADLGQGRYGAWRIRQQLQDRLPERFADLIEATVRFADPLLDEVNVPDHLGWDADGRMWTG